MYHFVKTQLPWGNPPNLHKSKMAAKYLESLIFLLIEVRFERFKI